MDNNFVKMIGYDAEGNAHILFDTTKENNDIEKKPMPPPKNTPIQLLINREFQVVARLREGEWVMSWNFEPLDLDSTDVLNWMPLPEPPKDGDWDG